MGRRPPDISICVPNYNNARYLEACLSSVAAQTFGNFEVVVVDDCSSDGSMEVLDAFPDERVRVHRNAVNLGIARVRNLCLALARGKWVTSLDSDDVYLSPDKLRLELDVVSYWAGRGVQAIGFSDIMHLDPAGTRMFLRSDRERLVEGDIHEGILSRSVLIPRDYLCTRQQLLSVGGVDEGLPLYEDWDLKIRLARRFPFYFSDCIGIGYRRHAGGLSAAPRAQHDYWIGRIRRKYPAAGVF